MYVVSRPLLEKVRRKDGIEYDPFMFDQDGLYLEKDVKDTSFI
jgi:hypothetical protein